MDIEVGSIVWVRRRNGSWWPGQILDPDYLSGSHVTLPRSGTPVKLLGREDASVDWYNLEKSKRVKAFRCGEFDNCIEKVESTHGMPLKKREKYARREDAILHALKLEKQILKEKANLGAGQIRAASRAKRSRYVYLPAESSDSLDYRETATHADMSSYQIGREFPYRDSIVGETESAFMDDVESDSTETDPPCSNSDSTETEPDMDEEMTTLSETGQDTEEHESTSSEEVDELAVSSDMPHLYRRELITRNEAVSKWQLKGKRNNRNLVKKSVGLSDGKGIMYGAEANTEGRSHHLGHKRIGATLHGYGNDFSVSFDDDDQMFGSEDGYSLNYTPVLSRRNSIHRGVDWDDWAWDDHLASRGYSDTKGFTPMYGDRFRFGGRTSSMLVDVDLKVQAGYQKQPVPIVSLLSKLDGKAIIGHPIQVEALKDSSSDILFSAVDDFSNDGIGIDGNSVLPPAWRTARRTANRIPRAHVSSTDGADVAAKFPSYQERNFVYKNINAGSPGHKANLQSKSGFKGHRSSIEKKSFKMLPKKASLSPSQKTRALSSFPAEHNLSRMPLDDSNSYQTDRLIIKPEISGPTRVACIPVQLVFSRLLEKINRPPLAAPKINRPPLEAPNNARLR